MTLQIDGRQTIGGVSVLDIRDLLRCSGGSFREDWVTDRGLPAGLCDELLRLEFIQEIRDTPHWRDSAYRCFGLTEKGKEFARATGAKKISKSTAHKTIEDLKSRIEEINASNTYMVRVIEVVVFGSYAAGAEKLGDVDVAIRTERKTDIFGSGRAWDDAGYADFCKSDRTAKSYLDILSWPDYKVRLFLKNRKRSISLHEMDEFIGMQQKAHSAFIILIGDEKKIRADIKEKKSGYSF